MRRSIMLYFVLLGLPLPALCQTGYISVTNTIRFGSNQIGRDGMAICVGRGVCGIAAQHSKGPGVRLNSTITYQPKQDPNRLTLECIFQIAKDSLNFLPDAGDSTYTFASELSIPAKWLNGIKNAKVCKGTIAQLIEPKDPTQNMVMVIPFSRGEQACVPKRKK